MALPTLSILSRLARVSHGFYAAVLLWRAASVSLAIETFRRKPRELSSPSPREQSLAERQNAIMSADGGNLRGAADLTGAAITEAGWIAGLVKTISQGIPGLPRTFTGPPDLVLALDGVTREQAAAARKRGESLDPCRGLYGDIFPEAEQHRMLAWGVSLGVCCVQRIPVPCSETDRWGEPRATFRMQARHPRFLRYEIARDLWWIQEYDGEKCVNEHPEYALFLPYGSLKPWEMAPWKAITLAYLMWRDAQFDRTRHSAMNGPIVWWRAGEHTTPKNKLDAEGVMADIERRARICMQRGEELGHTAPPAGDMAGVYRDIIADMKSDVALDLLGNDVITGAKSTGFGDGEVWERMTGRRIDYIASALERFEQRYVMDPWAAAQRPGVRMGIMYNTAAPSEVAPDTTASASPGADAKPAPGVEAVGQDIQVEPDQVLNGAQIAAAVDIVVQVKMGTLPRDSGLSLLRTGFNLTQEKATEIMGDAGRTAPPMQEAA